MMSAQGGRGVFLVRRGPFKLGKTLVFAFGLRLRSKTQRSKILNLGMRVPKVLKIVRRPNP